ncbi:Planctomycete cytochrome C [Lignipirellula cremea]|uniref:Planctomycete cytochrome C n=2 Tax=Lignipirellula cremea TaxID=2528010 RepID=A0A518DKF6_9BACT|nr:Planctomycete cytochrome C [Lignipirellula cremea]
MTKFSLSLVGRAWQLGNRTLRLRFVLCWTWTFAFWGFTSLACADEGIDFFEAKIRPVLVETCYGCHSADAQQQGKLKGNLVLDTRAGTRKGGDTGPAIVPGKVKDSLLLAALRHESFEMPPQGKLPESVIADFVKWVEMGAPDPREGEIASTTPEIDIEAGRQFWSLRPLSRPAIPSLSSDWPETEVDQFVARKLADNNISVVEDANAVTLVRRLYLDLVGLPPSPEEIVSFEQAALRNPHSAIENLVDQLLDSPQFGERWGRHWLDVARFAESNGATKNTVWPDAWRYRDYVIDSFNADKPFDQFLKEQIAGDLLPFESDEQRWEQIVAAGFLALGSKANDATRMEIIGEQLDVLGRSMLGLSIGCARCHDHKFDPIPTRDFYALAGILQNTAILDGKPFASLEARPDKSRLQQVKTFERSVASAARAVVQANDRLEELAQQQNLRRRPGDSWKDLLSRFPSGGQRDKAHETLQQLEKAEEDLEQLRQAGPPEMQFGVSVTDRAAKGTKWLNAQIHIRGSDSNLGDEAPRGVLQVLLPTSADQPEIADKESGRIQLAEVVSQHPLAARVMVNRIWHHLFGQGLVRTVDNFGTLGERPTHPELLEWLAGQMVEDGWSIKQSIRRIVLSRTYRLSADSRASQQAVDPENQWLWRHSPRRLDAEALRDAILSASGALDRQRPDRFDNAVAVSQMTNPSVADAAFVRAVYLPVARGYAVDLFEAFNFPPSDLVVGRRETPSVPTQALFMMNSRLVADQAQIMARRLLREAKTDDARVENAYLLALGRRSSPTETHAAVEFMKQFQLPIAIEGTQESAPDRQDAWAAFCQSLFASSEFRFLR